MESPSLSKLSVSKLKALALFKGISLKGCLEKVDIIASLTAGGVTDRDAATASMPSPTASPIPPPSSPPSSSTRVSGTMDQGWAFSDPLLPDGRSCKFARTEDGVGGATARAADVTSEEAKPEKKGLKFFQLKKGEREVVAKVVAGRKLPRPEPPKPPPVHVGGPRVVEAKPPGCVMSSLSISQLHSLAKDKGVNIEGCLEKDDILQKLVGSGITDEVASKPRVVIPPKLKPPPPREPDPPILSPQEQWAARQEQEWQKWQNMVDIHNKFSNRFLPGAHWEILAGFPLWAHEDSEERVAYMNASTMKGRPTVIEIVLVGKTRMRVRATRWNPLTKQMTGVDPTGWMDVAMAYDDEAGKLLMRPYDPTGMYVETKTGQEPVLMRRTVLQEKLRLDPEFGAGLHLTATPAGMHVDDIDECPGQPGLAVGDLIVGIGGVNLIGLQGKTAVEAAFRSAFTDGAEIEVAA